MKKQLSRILAVTLLLCSIASAETPKENTMKKPLDMQGVHDFIKDAKTYYIATVEGDQPRVRPFGTILIFEDKLYVQTGKKKNVFKQLEKNGKTELCAFNGESWIRVSGTLVPDNRLEPKVAMLEAFPSLKALYRADDENTQVLFFKDATATIYSFQADPISCQF